MVTALDPIIRVEEAPGLLAAVMPIGSRRQQRPYSRPLRIHNTH